MGHTLRGMMPRNAGDFPMKPCIWCHQPTDVVFNPEAMPQLGPQPMHMFCAYALIRAYERFQRGELLPEDTMRRIRALGSG